MRLLHHIILNWNTWSLPHLPLAEAADPDARGTHTAQPTAECTEQEDPAEPGRAAEQ